MRNERILKPCKVCGKPIPWSKGDYPKHYATKKYCSNTCSASANRPAKAPILSAANDYNERHGTNFDEIDFIEHLYFSEGMSINEISAHVGISSRSVSTRIEKAADNFRINWDEIYMSVRESNESEKAAFKRIWKGKGSLLAASAFLGVSYQSLRVRFYEIGILGKKLAKRKSSVAFKMMRISPKKLKSMSIKDMKARFGCCHQTAWMNRKLVLTKIKNEKNSK
jgi:hypothetical protein